MAQVSSPSTAFVWGRGGAQKTPDQIARDREIAAALMKGGMDYSPVGSWTQGAARVSEALLGAVDDRVAKTEEEAGKKSAADTIASLLGAGQGGSPDVVPPAAAEAAYAPGAVQAPPSGDARDLMIRTIYGEAGGEPPEGQLGVASVINNRLKSGKFGGSLEDVILAPKQFSLWNKGDPAGDMARKLDPSSPQYQSVAKVVDAVLGGNAPDPTGGALNYYNPNVASPDWGPQLAMANDVRIGNHRFVGDGGQDAPGMAQMAQAAPQAAGPSVQQLMEAAGNPWLSDGQRMVIGAMLKQQMEQQDPGSQLDLQYKQAQIDALRNKGQPRSWSKLDDNTLYDATTGETKSVRASGEAPLFSGNSVEAQSLNGLVKNRQLTPEQAMQLGAGKTVTGPNGEIIFMTPQGVFSKAGDAGAVSPVDGQTAAPPSSAPQNGMIPITDPKVSESQKNAMTYSDRMIQSGAILDNLGTAGTGFWDNLAAGIPIVGNSMVSPEFQKVDQAKRDFINAQLRRESGAAIAQSEFDNAEKQYFPQRGDSPEVIAQKAANRRTVIEGMRRDAGPTYSPPKIGGADGVPDGVDPEDWKYLTPEERKHWQ